MKKMTLALSAAALALAGGAVYAAAPMAGGDMTRADAVAKANAAWTKLDVNSDGVLNQADRDARRAQMFDRIDANKDGSISRDEFAANRGRDGRGHGEPNGDRAGMAGKQHGDHAGMGRGHRGGKGGMGMMMARMADSNNDGSVTRAEYDAAVGQHFDKVDSDRNGTITAAERQAAHAAMKQRRDQMRSAQPAPAPSGQ